MNRILLLASFTVIMVSLSTLPSYAEEKISVEILSVKPIRADQWTISWDACSLVEKIGQDFKISSDLEIESHHIDFILYRDQCITDILGNPVISVIDAKDPKSIAVSLDEATPLTNEQKIVITDILSSKIDGKYVAFFDVCAGDKRLIGPEILVSSDIDETQAPVGSVIGVNSCFGHSAEIHAENIDSIKVDFGSPADRIRDDASLTEVSEMEAILEEQHAEIANLKQELEGLKEKLAEKDETIQKKDAVLMEQIKVINDLAAMVTNTVYESLAKSFHFFQSMTLPEA